MRVKFLMPALILVSFGSIAQAVELTPSPAEIEFNKEVLACAAYYQIASDAISNMNAPQMQAVGDRLKQSGLDAVTLAKKYQSESEVNAILAQQVAAQQASLPSNKNLGGLMGRYKTQCQSLLANPQKRLDYWVMATM
ncbi:hypothetical protein TUM4644_16270 [Shewanella colwelliana]|uniref:Uncharacterized protein n=1 Tax=Shewanella colwelliana TaxID=23 RepID=A0A1E5INN6_SHECO|nr:hypothetical protein [Shewanella colwelliana]OEG72096.1 hypothetical protein BEL05_03630 [Shewanella colwelliana]GIU23138.1 hypothetical protein TUM4644_16270 [Shewanella colwelliana]